VHARHDPSDDVTRRPRPRATSRWLSARAEIAWLFALALVVRAAAAWSSPAILNDGATLLRAAERFEREGLWAAFAVTDHPLTPWLVSLAPAGMDPEFVATALCVLAGAVAVWPLHVVARRACGRHAATAAGIVYAALPRAVGVASTPLSSAVLLPLFLCGISLALTAGAPAAARPWIGRRGLSRRMARLVGAGLACGVAYLARPEGLVAAAAAVFAAFAFARRGKRLASAAVVVLAFVVVAAPYAAALSDQRGRFALSPKKDVARFVGAADTPSLDGEPTTPAGAVAAAIDGALTTPVFLLVVVGAFAPGRWRRRRAVGPRLLYLGVAATFVALVARLQAGWGYGGARHVLPGAILLLPFAGEGFVTVGGFISRVVARRRLAVVLASFTAIPLAVKAVMRPEGESQIDARRLGERLAEIAKAEGSTRLVVATFREPLVAYYADRARRADGGAARDVPLWGAYRLLLERSDAEGGRAELAATLRREGAQWFVVDMFRRTKTPGGQEEVPGAALAQRLVEDGVLGVPVVSAGSALTAFPVKTR
jgi:hypothetical protein